MPIEQTALEKHAENSAYKALLAIGDAIAHLRAAESALLDEERKHPTHVGIANQRKHAAYAEIVSELIGVRKESARRITGEPNRKAAA